MTAFKTIDEWMEGKVPGNIKVTISDWDSKEWFQPYFKARGYWHGLDEDGFSNTLNDRQYCSIWQEPEPERQLWWYRHKDSDWMLDTSAFTETEARNLVDKHKTWIDCRPSGIKLPKE